MKICFFTIWREDSETVGINMKIRNQVKAFSNLGMESFFCVSASSVVKLYTYNREEKKLVELEHKSFSKKAIHSDGCNKIQRKMSSMFRLSECLEFMDEMTNKYSFEVIYIRRIVPFTHQTGKLIQKWSRQDKKVFWEIPTWGENVKNLPRSLIKYRENKMYKKLEKDMKIVAISSGQIAKEQMIIINNGVDVDTIPVRKPLPHTGINIVCVATFSYWHGYDRLINGLKEYYAKREIENKEEVNIYFVGNGYVDELKMQAEKNGLLSHVFFTGVLIEDSLDELFNTMDVAIGNIGFFRKGVMSDTSIKIREYCARGIPFATALKVNDFPVDYPYIFRIPMNESYVDIDSILKWLSDINIEKSRMDMREYAETHLTWEEQLKVVIDAVE